MTTIPRLILLTILAGASAAAQNSDLGIMFTVARTTFDFGPIKRTEYRIGLQANYARQLLEHSKGRIYLELPVSAADGLFFTPGLRGQLNLSSRVAVYAAAGVGLASSRGVVPVYSFNPAGSITDVTFRSERRTSGAYNVGAGLDFRLTRLLSLRGELRRFRTESQPGLTGGRTFPSAQFGFAFHF